MVIAVYPGTFDPLTRGHEDLVRRAAGLFSKLVVGVADSRNKKPFFTFEERIAIAREVLSHYPNVEVAGFRGLLKDFVREHDARVIVRGLRAVSDFEYEFQLADTPAADDLVIERNGVRAVVDPVSQGFLEGAEIDFVDDLMGQSFRIKNPNATSSCGCGTSFSV